MALSLRRLGAISMSPKIIKAIDFARELCYYDSTMEIPTMTFDPYEIYAQWQRDRGMPAPTREWWNTSIRNARSKPRLSDTQWDHDREQEGDAQ